MKKRSSRNVNRMFFLRYLIINNVLKMLAQKCYVHGMFFCFFSEAFRIIVLHFLNVNTCFRIFREDSKVTCLQNDKLESSLNVRIIKKCIYLLFFAVF